MGALLAPGTSYAFKKEQLAAKPHPLMTHLSEMHRKVSCSSEHQRCLPALFDETETFHCAHTYSASTLSSAIESTFYGRSKQAKGGDNRRWGSKRDFFVCRPTTLPGLFEIKSQHPEAKLVVGNTEVGIEMKFKNMAYPHLVGVTHIPELNRIEVRYVTFAMVLQTHSLIRHMV